MTRLGFVGLVRTLPPVAVGLLCLLGTAACSQQSILEALSSSEDRALSQGIIEALQDGDHAKLIEHCEPEFALALDPKLPRMRAALPARKGSVLTLVDVKFDASAVPGRASVQDSYLAYEVDGQDTHALVRLGFERRGDGKVWLVALYTNTLSQPIWELTAFTLAGRSSGQFVFLLLAALSFGVVVASLVVLYRAQGLKRKWIWAIACLLGFGRFTMAWVPGASIAFAPMSVQVFGVIVSKSGIGPWQIGFGIPFAAVWVLLAEQRRRAGLSAEGRTADR